jgi:flagellar hook-associated protein 1 FlgK
MTNFTSKLLNSATSSLAAQQAVTATNANNVANASTPGYTRRVVQLQARSGSAEGHLEFGNGVEVGTVVRQADEFRQRVLEQAISDRAGFEVEQSLLSRIEPLFSVRGDRDTIGSTLTGFFSSLNDLTANPSSVELRSNVIERATDVVNSIRSTYGAIAQAQTEADRRIYAEVDAVNVLTSQIATLNGKIAGHESGNGNAVAADERDRRDKLLNALAEKLSFSKVEQGDGSVLLTLPNGFALVAGTTARPLEVTTSPSFGTGSLPPSLAGGVLGYVVYDYDRGPGSAQIDLTQMLGEGQGTIGGLLRVRGYNDPANASAFQATGLLVELASRVEAIARALLTSVNRTYLGGDEDSTTAGLQPSSGDLNGNPPAVYGLFDFQHGGVKDVNGDGLPNDILNPALGIDNFSSILQLTTSDPRKIAAALDLDPVSGARTFSSGDGSNAAALAALQGQQLTFSAGLFSITGTFDEACNEAVAHVGSLKARSDSNSAVAEDNFLVAANKRDEVAGVSLDEEFTSLIASQRAFQAAARLLKIADTLLDQIVSLV